MATEKTYDGKTGEERFAEWLEQFRAEHGKDPHPEFRQIAEDQFLSPAGRLSYETTACPPWCDKRHDRSDQFSMECVIHCGPYHAYSYEPGVHLPSEMADGWSWHLEAYEWPESPGTLTVCVVVVCKSDGLNKGNYGLEGDWYWSIPIERAAQIGAGLLHAHGDATRLPGEDAMAWSKRMFPELAEILNGAQS